MGDPQKKNEDLGNKEKHRTGKKGVYINEYCLGWAPHESWPRISDESPIVSVLEMDLGSDQVNIIG